MNNNISYNLWFVQLIHNLDTRLEQKLEFQHGLQTSSSQMLLALANGHVLQFTFCLVGLWLVWPLAH